MTNTTNQNYATLDDFLKSHKCSDKSKTTHTRIGCKEPLIFGGSYHIPDDEIMTFNRLFFNKVFKLGKYEYLTQVQDKQSSPLVIDLDFRYEPSVKTRQHTNEHIEDIIDLITQGIKEYFDISNIEEYTVYVSQKPNVNVLDDKTKDGIHIQFSLNCSAEEQQLVRKFIIDNIDDELKGIPLKNSIEEVFDEGVAKRQCNWMVYGSRKPNNEAYEITNTFTFSNDELSQKEWKNTKIRQQKRVVKLNLKYEHNPVLQLKDEFLPQIEQFKTITQTKNTNTKHNIQTEDETSENASRFWDYAQIIPKDKLAEYHNFFRFCAIHYNLVGWSDYERLDDYLSYIDGYDSEGNKFIYSQIEEDRQKEHKARWSSLRRWCDEFNKEKRQEIDEKYRHLNVLCPVQFKRIGDEYFFTGLKLFKEWNLKQHDTPSNSQLKSAFNDIVLKECKKGYEIQKAYFERFITKIEHPLCYMKYSNGKNYIVNSSELKELFENFNIHTPTLKDTDKTESFIKTWKKDVYIQTKEVIDFLPPPLKCPKNTYNTFCGLEIENVEPNYDEETDIEIFLNHMFYMCGEDKAGYDYFLKYLAHSVQQAGIIPRVALLFKGEQGTGKNVFLENFGERIFGENGVLQTAEMDKVIGKFSMINNKFMVILDEANSKDSFANSDLIKNIITCNTLPWERKGVDGIKIRNVGRYIFLSNNDTPISIPIGDRRFVVYETSNAVKNNTAYFKKLIKAFNNDKQVRKLYDYLMSVDISDFDTVNDRPKTEAYLDIQSATIPTVARFLEQSIYEYNERNVINSEDETFKTELLSSGDLYINFKAFCQESGFKISMTSTKFGRELNKYKGVEKQRKSTGYMYSLDYSKIEEYLKSKQYM